MKEITVDDEPEEVVEQVGSLTIMTHSLQSAQEFDPAATRAGDVKLSWRRGNRDEEEAARAAFVSAQGKKFAAFKKGPSGEFDQKVTAFDASAEEILMVAPVVGG